MKKIHIYKIIRKNSQLKYMKLYDSYSRLCYNNNKRECITNKVNDNNHAVTFKLLLLLPKKIVLVARANASIAGGQVIYLAQQPSRSYKTDCEISVNLVGNRTDSFCLLTALAAVDFEQTHCLTLLIQVHPIALARTTNKPCTSTNTWNT